MAKRAFNLPNLLTYGRILAVPLVVVVLLSRGRLQSSDFARWCGARRSSSSPASPTISTAISRAPGSSNRTSAACSIRSPTSCWSATCLLLLAADTDRTIARLVALGGDHHPVPRDPGLGPARVPRRAEGQRARHAARQVEDDDRRWWRSASCWPARPATRSCPTATQIGIVTALDLGARDALHRLRLFPRRRQAHRRRVSDAR